MRPLQQLLRGEGGKWTEEHTEIVNDLARQVSKRVRLGLIDVTQSACMYVSVSDTDCAIVLT